MNHVAPRQGTVDPAAPSPCSACPWRTVNHGKPHPAGWYTRANLRRLWAQLRRGERMTCHPTDPHNPVPAGAVPAPETATTLECCGALILQQREFMVAQDFIQKAELEGNAMDGKINDGVKQYRRARPKGLTREGIMSLLNRSIFSGGPFGKPMTKPDLRQAVSHPDLPWEAPK